MNNRESLGSRLGFILLSAGCAIGCGNVWKFPYMAGKFGGGGFVLIYIICLIVLGLPVMTMEFSLGRASQASPLYMMQKLQKKDHKWGIYGPFALLGNVGLMAFYTVIAGYIFYYFIKFLTGDTATLSWSSMTGSPSVSVIFMAITVVLGFAVLCFDLQKGLERVTKILMPALLILMFGLAIRSFFLGGAAAGLKFYLVPDFSKINGDVIVAAMQQAFFTLSLGIGSMAIFGSYINKDRSLMGESSNIIILDTLVAVVAGLIIFPACTTYGIEVNAGPSLLFDSMAAVFNNMAGGRWWGCLFFLFMVFAAFSTILAVFENILAMVREYTGWSRPKGALICGIGLFILSLTTALGFNVLSGFHPFAESTNFLDFWDFIVNSNLLPLGSLVFALFCCYKFGWGWDNFVAEANAGKGMKVKNWMRPVFGIVVPVVVIVLYVYGLINYPW